MTEVSPTTDSKSPLVLAQFVSAGVMLMSQQDAEEIGVAFREASAEELATVPTLEQAEAALKACQS
jgi:hypothetical protein